MKILKSFLILTLLLTLSISCTAEDITEESETNATENNIQATGEEGDQADQTEKG
jgi:hypothetical protein